jgi:hypothetical protein
MNLRLTFNWIFLFIALSFLCAAQAQPVCLAELGANLNMGPETFRASLMDRSQVRWTRVIIDMNRLLEERKSGIYGSASLSRAKMKLRLDSIKKAKQNGLHTIVSLKFDFRDLNERLPDPGSDREREVHELISFVVHEIGGSIDILVAGNEPIVETLRQDMDYDPAKNRNPMSSFYIRVAKVSHNLLREADLLDRVRLYIGAFNRLDKSLKRNIEGVQDLLNYALRTKFIDGIDLHIHVPSMEAFEEQLHYTRTFLGSSRKGLIVSEFSLMWLFKRHMSSPLCFGHGQQGVDFCSRLRAESEIGRHLLERRGVATEVEFYNAILQAPADQKLSKDLFQAYFKSRSYLPADFIGEANVLFNRYGVRVATYTFDQDNPNDPETWDWKGSYEAMDTPNRVYALFVPQMVKSDPAIRSNNYFYEPFKRAVLRSNRAIERNPACAGF